MSVEQAESHLIDALGTIKFFNLRRETDPADWKCLTTCGEDVLSRVARLGRTPADGNMTAALGYSCKAVVIRPNLCRGPLSLCDSHSRTVPLLSFE
jgi:hypothetical protein